MISNNQSTNEKITVDRIIALVCIFAVVGSIAACTMPFKIVPNSQEEGPPPQDESFTEGIRLEFFVERDKLQPGECTMLFWDTEDGFGTFLNKEPVESEGEFGKLYVGILSA
jgi:hypothetical protein